MSVNNFYSQKIRLKEDNSTYIRTPHTSKDEINNQVDQLLKNNNLIEPSHLCYNSLIILYKKSLQTSQKNGECVIVYR